MQMGNDAAFVWVCTGYRSMVSLSDGDATISATRGKDTAGASHAHATAHLRRLSHLTPPALHAIALPGGKSNTEPTISTKVGIDEFFALLNCSLCTAVFQYSYVCCSVCFLQAAWRHC
jgi:hypothetical protein